VGGFALPNVIPGVLVVDLASEVEELDLEAVGVLPLPEVAFLALSSLLSAARPPHILVRAAAAHALLSASWALTTRGGGSPATLGLAQ